MATDPSHVLLARSQGAPIWPVVMFWALAANGVFTLTRNTKTSIWVSIISGACIGWSVMAYFVGLFLALPLVFLAIIVLRKKPRHMLSFLVAGLIAYSPVIYAIISIYIANPELLRNFGVPAWSARPSVGLFSTDNLGRLKNLTAGAFESYEFARGVIGGFSVIFPSLRTGAFTGALLITLIALFREYTVDFQQRVFFWLIGAIFATYFIAVFLLKGTSVHHMLPATILAAAVCASITALLHPIRIAAFLICAVLILTNIMSLDSAHNRLVDTGGRGYYNENYSIIAPILTGPLEYYHPVFVGWGFHLQFLFLTEGKKKYSFMGQLQVGHIRDLLDQHGKIAVIADLSNHKIIMPVFEVERTLRFGQRDGVELFSIVLIHVDQQDLDQALGNVNR